MTEKNYKGYFRDKIQVIANKCPERILKISTEYVGFQGKEKTFQLFYSGRIRVVRKYYKWDDKFIEELFGFAIDKK